MKRQNRAAGEGSGPLQDPVGIALHESAHAVAAIRRRLRFKDVRVLKRPSRRRMEDGMGVCGYMQGYTPVGELTLSLREWQEGYYSWDLCRKGYAWLVVNLAGPAFDKMMCPSTSYEELFAGSAKGDIRNVNMYLDNVKPPALRFDRERIIKRAIGMAERLVKREKSYILAVALELIEAPSRRLTEDQVREITG